jgi:hypothetical protein
MYCSRVRCLPNQTNFSVSGRAVVKQKRGVIVVSVGKSAVVSVGKSAVVDGLRSVRHPRPRVSQQGVCLLSSSAHPIFIFSLIH